MEQTVQKNNKNKIITISILSMLALAAVGGTAFAIYSMNKSSQKTSNSDNKAQQTQSPTASQTATATPTAVPVKLKQYYNEKINIKFSYPEKFTVSTKEGKEFEDNVITVSDGTSTLTITNDTSGDAPGYYIDSLYPKPTPAPDAVIFTTDFGYKVAKQLCEDDKKKLCYNQYSVEEGKAYALGYFPVEDIKLWVNLSTPDLKKDSGAFDTIVKSINAINKIN